jgi:hypothetical protein
LVAAVLIVKQAVALSNFTPNWVFVQKHRYCYDISTGSSDPEADKDIFCSVLDPIVHGDLEAAKRKIKRLELRLKHRDLRIKQLEQEKELERTRAKFRTWQRECSQYIALQDKTTFIEIPRSKQPCLDKGCIARRADIDSIGLCKHDLAALYKKSGKNVVKLLKEERLRWHPDRFGRSCAVEMRRQLQQKASQMFAVMGEVIADETKAAGKENVQP